jgi:hypothetical protein
VVELIVRRGALDRYDKLRQDTQDLPVKLSWDRRLHQRRSASRDVDREERKHERRREPPFIWDVADFVAVEIPTKRTPRAKKR